MPTRKRPQVSQDPIVDEIHKVREKLLEECGGDLDRLMDRLAAREGEDGSRVITDPKEVKTPSPRRRREGV